jgi:hypothetical protein
MTMRIGLWKNGFSRDRSVNRVPVVACLVFIGMASAARGQFGVLPEVTEPINQVLAQLQQRYGTFETQKQQALLSWGLPSLAFPEQFAQATLFGSSNTDPLFPGFRGFNLGTPTLPWGSGIQSPRYVPPWLRWHYKRHLFPRRLRQTRASCQGPTSCDRAVPSSIDGRLASTKHRIFNGLLAKLTAFGPARRRRHDPSRCLVQRSLDHLFEQ